MLDKSIDFLLENAGIVIQYRLRKEILQNITAAEEEKLLTEIYQLPYFKLVESYARPNGFIGNGLHGHSNWRGETLHETPLQDCEASARLLTYYAVPKNHPLLVNLSAALRDEDVLHGEFLHKKSERERFDSRYVGLCNGSGLMVIVYTLLAMFGDENYTRSFQEISLDAFGSVLPLMSVDDITEFNPNLKRKYNYPYIFDDTYFPCMYHLTTLAYSQAWRTPQNVKIVARAINHLCEINSDDHEANTLQVKGKGGFRGILWALLRPFLPFVSADSLTETMQRRYLTEIAMLGVGCEVDVIRQSADNLQDALATDGILRSNSKVRNHYPGAYGEVFLEDNYRKKTALACDLTFWAVQFLHYVEGAEI